MHLHDTARQSGGGVGGLRQNCMVKPNATNLSNYCEMDLGFFFYRQRGRFVLQIYENGTLFIQKCIPEAFTNRLRSKLELGSIRHCLDISGMT